MARRDALLRLHKSLVARQTALRNALAGELADLRRERGTQAGDSANAGFDAGSEEIAAQLAEIEGRELAMIDQALRRLKEGMYGTCEMCQTKISIQHLNVQPYTTRCLRCQRSIESAEGLTPAPPEDPDERDRAGESFP